MPKTINMTITERVLAMRLMNESKASIETLAFFLEDVKKLTVTEEEWTLAERVKTENPEDHTITWNWNDTIVMKDVELAQQTVDALLAKIQEKSENKEFTLQDVAVVEFSNKLKA